MKMEQIEREAWNLVEKYLPNQSPYQKYLARKVMVRHIRVVIYDLKHLLRDRKQSHLQK